MGNFLTWITMLYLATTKFDMMCPITFKDDRDNFLSLALESYQRCLVIGSKYDLRVVFIYLFILVSIFI